MIDSNWCPLRGRLVPDTECVTGCPAPESRVVCAMEREGVKTMDPLLAENAAFGQVLEAKPEPLPRSFRDVIRQYSRSVERGTFDRDLTPRQRKLVSLMLNLASNSGHAAPSYPPNEGQRNDTRRALGTILGDARWLVDAAASKAGAEDFAVAGIRAQTILENL